MVPDDRSTARPRAKPRAKRDRPAKKQRPRKLRHWAQFEIGSDLWFGAWLVPTTDHRLRISDDAAGTMPWLTLEEAAKSDLRTSVRTAVEDLCDAYGVPLDAARRALLASLDVPGLEALRAAVKQRRSWPD